tara:strand:- start:9 stop:446 length:438 start_codon:yes stop_codon:yes gene_type:complete
MSTQKKTRTSKPNNAKDTKPKTQKKKFSRAQMKSALTLQVNAGLITQATMDEQLAKLDQLNALTDGTRSKDETTQKCFDVAKKSVRAIKKGTKRAGTSAWVGDDGKMVIAYITTAREGSSKFNALAKGEYANDVRVARINAKKRK